MFTTLLVFNLAFAHWLLGETITRDKVASACLVLLGAIISTAGTPSGVPTQFTPAEVEALLASGGRVCLGSNPNRPLPCSVVHPPTMFRGYLPMSPAHHP